MVNHVVDAVVECTDPEVDVLTTVTAMDRFTSDLFRGLSA